MKILNNIPISLSGIYSKKHGVSSSAALSCLMPLKKDTVSFGKKNKPERAEETKKNLRYFHPGIIEHQRQLALRSPDLYVNGDDYENDDDMREDIEDFFSDNYVAMLQFSSSADNETFNNLLRLRLDDAEEYLSTFKKFSPEMKDLYKGLVNSKNTSGKPFSPSQKIGFIDLLQGYKLNNLSCDIIKDMIAENRIDVKKLNMHMFKQVMKNSGFSDEEFDRIPEEKLLAWNMKYLHLLVKEINQAYYENAGCFDDILRAANLYDFQEYINDKSDIYGQANANTKSAFEQSGMDYEKWVHPLKDNEIRLVCHDENQDRIKLIASKITENMNALMQTRAKDHIKKQFPRFIQNDEFVFPQEYSESKAKLKEFITILTDETESGQMSAVWKRAKSNLRDPKKARNAQNTLMILDHLVSYKSAIPKIDESKSKSGKNLDWTIKMWDRVPQKDIFQGNYSTCCIGMGNGNGKAMPHYLMNTAYNMIEFVDTKSGRTTGNALCYFVKLKDGSSAFVIDNIEIKNSLIPAEEAQMKLRQAVTEYASKIAKDVTGKDDIPVYMSKKYNDVKYSDLPLHKETVSLLGDTDCTRIYMDLYSGWVYKEEYTKNCNVLQLK